MGNWPGLGYWVGFWWWSSALRYPSRVLAYNPRCTAWASGKESGSKDLQRLLLNLSPCRVHYSGQSVRGYGRRRLVCIADDPPIVWYSGWSRCFFLHIWMEIKVEKIALTVMFEPLSRSSSTSVAASSVANQASMAWRTLASPAPKASFRRRVAGKHLFQRP